MEQEPPPRNSELRKTDYGDSYLVNSKAVMNNQPDLERRAMSDFTTPYGKLRDDGEIDPYVDEESEMHNITISEAYEHQWDIRKTLIGGVLLALMFTIIFLVIWFRDDIMEQVNNFMDTIREYPVSTVFIFFGVMTVMISASVPSAIPQVSGSYIFVHAFGFFNGFCLMVVVDYFAMLIGWVPPFILARYLMRSWVMDYTSDKPKLLALSRALSMNAKKLVCLMRMWALTPYVVFNIVCGITNMTLLDYWIGNLAIIFWDAPYIYICWSISKITGGVEEASAGAIVEFIVIIVSIFIVIGVAYYVYKVAQAEADKIMEFRKSSALARKTKSRIGSQHEHE